MLILQVRRAVEVRNKKAELNSAFGVCRDSDQAMGTYRAAELFLIEPGPFILASALSFS